MFFFKTHAENELGRVGSLVPHPFVFFRKALYKLKTTGQDLSFDIFW